MAASVSSVSADAGDPGLSTWGNSTFLFTSHNVGQTVEVHPEAEYEPSQYGSKVDQKSG